MIGGVSTKKRGEEMRDTVRRGFLLAEGVLYLWFLAWDVCFPAKDTTWIKYSALLLCVAYAWDSAGRGGSRLIAVALVMTAGADTFLLVLNRCYMLGVLLFCGVQGAYLVRVLRANGGRTWWGARLAVLAVLGAALLRLGLLDLLTGAAAVYFSTFVCTAVQSSRCSGPAFRRFTAGLCLFLCCDVCVAVFNVPQLFPAEWYAFARVGMWLFYLPAQVLIARSGEEEREC